MYRRPITQYEGMGCGKYEGNWDQRKDVENSEKGRNVPRSAVMLDGGISKYVVFLQGVAQRCTLSLNVFKVYISDMVVAAEGANHGVTMGEDAVSGLMFADDFVGISGTPEGLQKQREGTRVHQEMESDSERVRVVVCNEDKANPVTFNWRWGEDDLPIVVQYTYLGVEMPKDCSWDAHVAKVIGKGKAQVARRMRS